MLLWALFLYFRLVCPPPPKTPTSESALLCWLMLLAADPAGISTIVDAATAECVDSNGEFEMKWMKRQDPNPLVGDLPYAEARVTLKGFQMLAQPVKVDGAKHSCAYLAICASMHSLLKRMQNQEILLRYLSSAEITNANIIAAFGKEIVEFDKSAPEQKRHDLGRALEFRTLLANHLEGNHTKFHAHFKDKNPSDYGGEDSGTGGGSKRVANRWKKFILYSYWDNVLACILSDLMPSLSIITLYSASALDGGKGKLCFFDGDWNQELTSESEKMRIVLHVINPTLGRVRHCYKLRIRDADSSDSNHYEHVLLDVDLKFHFPEMDQASLDLLQGK